MLDGEGLAQHLEKRVQQTLEEVLSSNVWRTLSDPASDLRLITEILKEVYLEISMYQPDSIEAAIASIGQFPRSMPVALIEEMLHHQVEEFDHGEMALRDYLKFGGDEAYARSRTQSPSAFAVAAMWRNITHKRDPFLYLGAVYLFDGLTPIATKIVMDMMAQRSGAGEGLEFIRHHATADLEHTRQIRALIVEVADLYPHSKAAIAYGYEYFKHVYPLPVWEAACTRAVRRLGREESAAAA
ncbi:iron-containing redox enzyme family protein [Aquibium microcysteis]|uniref:iron-containing redox enzyme family protein n=1 Tax=Aquibium microcysteis TaxID=675281 RepID=UPI00165CF976|nr:iron-containing redox enzyme family protein [Aquibium microcysteis]